MEALQSVVSMKTNEVHTFILKYEKEIYKYAHSVVKSCLWLKHSRRSDFVVDARNSEDIVHDVLMKVWSEPIELGPELTIRRIKQVVGNLTRNEVSERNRRDKLTRPRPDKGFGELTAEKLFDQLLSDDRESETHQDYEARLTTFVERVYELIAFYDSDSTHFEKWFVLTEWLQQKSMAEIAVDGDLTVSQVANIRKKIRFDLRKNH